MWKHFLKTVFITALASPIVAACADSAPYVDNVEDQTELASGLEDGSELASDDAIAVYGRFKEYLGDTLFVMEEGELDETANVLVVNASDRSFSVPGDEGTPLWAVGSIAPLSEVELEDINPNVLAALEGETALVASRITLSPEPSELTENAVAFYNQDVTIYGEVEQVGADNTFILENPELFEGRGVIVIETGDVTTQEIPDDAKIAVSGVLRPYVLADLQEDYALTWDTELVDRFNTEYEQVPVLIADLIVPTNND